MSHEFVSKKVSNQPSLKLRPAGTRKLARSLARSFDRLRMTGVVVFALVGELGSGKTTFVQAFLRALGVKGRITSPTFLLIRNYEIPAQGQNDKRKVYHIDAYRIHKPKELTDLGLKGILKNKDNIVLIEWADRVKKLIPKDAVWINFSHGNKDNERIIKLDKRLP